MRLLRDLWATSRRSGALTVALILLGAVGYFVLPVDAIPDVLAGIGFTDDASVLMAAIAMVAHHITPEHRERARQRLDELIR